MEGRMKQFRRGVLCNKPSGPDNWKFSDYKTILLKNTNCPDLDSFLISFDYHMGGQIETSMPIKKSGFIKFDADNGVIPKTYYYKEPHGVQCQHPAHLGPTQALDVEHDFCQKCIKNGGNILNQHYWTLPKLIYIWSTCPIFFVVLVSRSSTHMTISNSMYKALDETIIQRNRKITDVLRRETGLQYEIHVIAEVGIQGSALSALADSHGHLGNEENKLHVPAADISNLFFFYNSYRSAKFGYFSNAPGDLTGKLSNHIHNLRLLERGGIDPSDVYFMSYGVHIKKADNQKIGVEQNFVMFNGKKMLERAEEIKTKQNFPNSTEANIDGYITGMAKEGSSRVLRNINRRKVRVQKEK